MAWRIEGVESGFTFSCDGIEAEARERLRQRGFAALHGEIQFLLIEFGDDLSFSNILAEIDRMGIRGPALRR